MQIRSGRPSGSLLDQVVGAAPAALPSPSSPRSSIMILKPPAVPNPRTGGAPKTMNAPSSIPSSNSLRSRAAIAFALCVRDRRAAPRTDRAPRTSLPRCEPLAPSENDMPANADHVGHAAVGLADHLVGLRHHLDRALQRGRIGKLHHDEQIALVLVGNESGGHLPEAPIGQIQQPAVDQQAPTGSRATSCRRSPDIRPRTSETPC